MKLHVGEQGAHEGRCRAAHSGPSATCSEAEVLNPRTAAAVARASGEGIVQRMGWGRIPSAGTIAIARGGVRGGGQALPHRQAIQRSFGAHGLGHVRAYVGGASAAAAEAIGAEAYTFGSSIAFRKPPTLRVAAHEAAHAYQQREGVHLPGHVGRPGDPYERHAEAVAEAVVRGQKAEGLLSAMPGGSPLAQGATASPFGTHSAVQATLPPPAERGPLPWEVKGRDLFYGLSERRMETLVRLDETLSDGDPLSSSDRRLTVDSYVEDLGIKELFIQSRATGLFPLRRALTAVYNMVSGEALRTMRRMLLGRDPIDEELEEKMHDVVLTWDLEIADGDPELGMRDTKRDTRGLVGYLLTLVEARKDVGLYDFVSVDSSLAGIGRAVSRVVAYGWNHLQAWRGAGARPLPYLPYWESDRLGPVRRINKNLTEDLYPDETPRFRDVLTWWLRPVDRERNDAHSELKAAALPAEMAEQLYGWVRDQVIRRTSKQGINFALLHARSRIFFNMGGPGDCGTSDGMRALYDNRTNFRADQPDNMENSQAITISELRRIDKLLQAHPELAERVSLYNEL